MSATNAPPVRSIASSPGSDTSSENGRTQYPSADERGRDSLLHLVQLRRRACVAPTARRFASTRSCALRRDHSAPLEAARDVVDPRCKACLRPVHGSSPLPSHAGASALVEEVYRIDHLWAIDGNTRDLACTPLPQPRYKTFRRSTPTRSELPPSGSQASKLAPPDDPRRRERDTHAGSRYPRTAFWGEPVVYALRHHDPAGADQGLGYAPAAVRPVLRRSRSVRVVLFDGRDESPSTGKFTQLNFTDRTPGLLKIPPGVWHADENWGEDEALIVNYPTRAFEYASRTGQVPHRPAQRRDPVRLVDARRLGAFASANRSRVGQPLPRRMRGRTVEESATTSVRATPSGVVAPMWPLRVGSPDRTIKVSGCSTAGAKLVLYRSRP